MKSITKVLWGIVIIIVGLSFALNSLGLASIHLFRGWWTLFIIIPSFIGLFDDDDKSGSLIGLIIGIALLLSARGVVSFSTIIKLIVPFIIICIGVSILFHGLFGDKVKKIVEKNITKDKKELEYITTVMGSENKIITGEFKGSNIDTVFGNLTLDMREAKLGESTSLIISSIFGKVDILVPSDVDVKVNSTKVFGSVNCSQIKSETKKSSKTKEKVIYVEAVSVFGGVVIR